MSKHNRRLWQKTINNRVFDNFGGPAVNSVDADEVVPSSMLGRTALETNFSNFFNLALIRVGWVVARRVIVSMVLIEQGIP